MHSLAPYTIRVYDQGLAGPLKERFHNLGAVRGLDALFVIKEFLDSHSDAYHEYEAEDGSKKTIKFTNVDVKGRRVFGIAEYGDYGIKGKLVNIATGTKTYDKKKDDSDVMSLYFQFYLPSDRSVGLCVFHNIHGKGVKGIFDELFNAYFKDKTQGLRVGVKPFSYEKVVKEWMQKAYVKEIRLNKFRPKSAVSDMVDKLTENYSEVIFKPKIRGGNFGTYWSFTRANNQAGENLQAVDLFQASCDTVKAAVVFQGKQRIFSLTSKTLPFSAVDFDHTNVDMDDGEPVFDSMNKFSSDLIDDMRATI